MPFSLAADISRDRCLDVDKRGNFAYTARSPDQRNSTGHIMSLESIEANPTRMTDEQRDQLAVQTVNRYSAWSAAAGVIPIPVVDIMAVGGLQLQMLRRLAEIYDVPFSDNLGKSLLASTLGSIVPISAAAPAAAGLGSLLKIVPIVGTTVAALTMPAMSAGATYVVGKVFIQHFASGGTLLDFNPAEYRDFMKSQVNKSST
jgi:uncharacterized protein (DUF697 family)